MGSKIVVKSEIKAGILLSYLTIILGNVISIVYTPVMLRLLGQNEYGLMSLVTSVVAYLGILNFGLAASYVRYNAMYRAKNDKQGEGILNGMYLTIFSLLGVVALICGLILFLNIENMFGAQLNSIEVQKAKILMSIMVFNVAISFPVSVFGMYNNAYEKYIFGRVMALITTIVSPLVTLPLLLMGYGAIGVVTVQTIVSVGSAALMIYYSISKLKMKIIFKSFDYKLVKDITIFSSYIFMNIIVDQINWNVDKFILGVMVGTTGVAIYTIGAQFNLYYQSMAQAFSGVFTSRVNALVANRRDIDELSDLFTKVGRFQYIILGLIVSGFYLSGKEFIYMWAGPEYGSSYLIAMVLLVSVTIPLIQSMGVEILRAMNKHQFRSKVFLGIAVGNIAISIPLCKLYGGLGCAIGTAVAVTIGNLFVMNIYYDKKIGIDVRKFWLNILQLLPSTIIAIGLGLTMKNFIIIKSFLTFTVFVGLYSVIYCLLVWLIGFNKYEKSQVLTPLKRFISRGENKI